VEHIEKLVQSNIDFIQ